MKMFSDSCPVLIKAKLVCLLSVKVFINFYSIKSQFFILKRQKTERQKDRKTERQKDRKTERQKDRKTVKSLILTFI
jgi:hypothetical protein